MPDTLATVRTVDQLRKFVHATLCERENLLADQFHTQMVELMQSGAACGLQFHLQGPRSVKLSAIWARQPNIVYFYDTRGLRFDKIRLSHQIVVDAPAA